MNQPIPNSVRRMTGGMALAEMLQLTGCGPIFGMGGFQLLPFYEACRALSLKHYLINDERCGAFAADAWGKVTNRPAVADGTLGPGATNLTTGLIESLNAGIPMIAIAGDANREHAWKNMTQEARQIEILRPAVKEVIRVEVIKRLPEHVRRAFAVATSGRPGPVLLDVPEDIAHSEHDFDATDFWVDPETLKAQARRTRPDGSSVEKAAALLAKAERPLILAGGGVHISEAWDVLTQFAEAYGIPVAHTMSGKGAIPCNHSHSAGLFGRYDRIANALIGASDCLLVVGCKLGEIATKRFALIPPGKPVIHVEIEPTEIGRTTRTDVALAGDAKLTLMDLAAALGNGKATAQSRSGYVAELPKRMAEWREGARDRLEFEGEPDQRRTSHEPAQQADAGRRHPRRRRRLRGPLGRADVRHQGRRSPLPARPWLRVDRLRRAGRHRRPACSWPQATRRHHVRRRRLQYEPRRARDRAAAWNLLRRDRLQ